MVKLIKQITSKKLNASIIEPVIAVIILVISMAIAFTILGKTDITPTVKARNRGNELISTELYRTINESDFLDKEEQIGAFKISKQVELLNNTSAQVTLSITDLKQKEILKKQLIIPIKMNYKDD